MGLQAVGLLIVMFFPETVTWLVDEFFGDDPPPVDAALQFLGM
jgi:hypothetical protein